MKAIGARTISSPNRKPSAPSNAANRPSRAAIFAAVNAASAQQLAIHKHYAQTAGLARLAASLDSLEHQLASLAASPHACMFSIGWGGGFLTKAAFLDTTDAAYRSILKQSEFYARAIQSGLPFPKTRRVVFQDGEPATLPGWVIVDLAA